MLFSAFPEEGLAVPLAMYFGKLRGRRISWGQSFLAMYEGMALRTPYFLAS